jgi:hypothetical protein
MILNNGISRFWGEMSKSDDSRNLRFEIRKCKLDPLNGRKVQPKISNFEFEIPGIVRFQNSLIPPMS